MTSPPPRKSFWSYPQYKLVDLPVWAQKTEAEKQEWREMKQMALAWLENPEELPEDDVDQREWKKYVLGMRNDMFCNLDYVLIPYILMVKENRWDLLDPISYVLPPTVVAFPVKRTIYEPDELVLPATPGADLTDDEMDDLFDFGSEPVVEQKEETAGFEVDPQEHQYWRELPSSSSLDESHSTNQE